MKLLGDVVIQRSPLFDPAMKICERRIEVAGGYRLSGNWYVIADPILPSRYSHAGEMRASHIKERRTRKKTAKPLAKSANLPSQTIHSVYTLDTFRRLVQVHLADGLAGRLRALAKQIELAGQIAEQLGEWKKLAPEEKHQISWQLRQEATKLAAAHTSFRKDAGRRLLLSKDITDSLGRLNPQAMGLTVKAAEDRLSTQRTRDETSLRANYKRAQALAAVDRLLDIYLGRLMALLELEPSPEVGAKITEVLDQLAIKPYYYGANFARRLLDGRGPSQQVFADIRRAFAAEQLLRQYESALAAICRQSGLFKLNQDYLADLIDLVRQMKLAPYNRLAERLTSNFEVMKTKSRLKEESVAKVARTGQYLIRNRVVDLGDPDTFDWLPSKLTERLGAKQLRLLDY